MRTRSQNIPILFFIAALAVALTWAMSGSTVARSTFQSPLEPGATETETPTPDLTGPGTETPAGNMDTTPTPTEAAAEPIVTPLVSTTPTVPGFLPAPTLVNPADLVQGRPALLPGGAPLAGPAMQPLEATVPPAPSQVPGPAQLIDNAVVAMGYFWLCCGALLVAALALAVVWLARRSRSGRR